MAATAHLASHRQTLYFASLHCQRLAETGSGEALAAGAPLQMRQCLLEAATECLYRSGVFLAQHLLDQSAARGDAVIADGPGFIGWLSQAKLAPAADPALQHLVQAFTAPNSLAELLVAYQALWQPVNASPRPADHLRLVDTSVSLARCTEWHGLLERLAAECIAMQSEF